jgi:hypothetical protein
MDKKQNPFSLYDFLGYFIPGLMSSYLIVIYLGICIKCDNPVVYLEQNCNITRHEMYLLFILISYTIGHAVSFVSSITVERYSIWRYGYPSKYILGINEKDYWDVEIDKFKSYMSRSIVGLIMLPVVIWELAFIYIFKGKNKFPSRLDPLLIDIIKNKISKLVINIIGTNDLEKYRAAKDKDYFRLVYHYVLENAPAHQNKFQNYVALYGYMRTITLIGIISSWGSLIFLFLDLHNWKYYIQYYFWLSFAGCIFYMGFVKFYRRFTLEALMALAVIFNEGTDAP